MSLDQLIEELRTDAALLISALEKRDIPYLGLELHNGNHKWILVLSHKPIDVNYEEGEHD